MATELVLRIRADGTAKVVSDVGQVSAAVNQLHKTSSDTACGVEKVSDQVGALRCAQGVQGSA